MKSPQQLIAEVRERLAKATPGPWKREQIGDGKYDRIYQFIGDGKTGYGDDCVCDVDSDKPEAIGNAELIASAPTDLALLTDCLSVALEKLAEVQSKVGMCIYGSSDTSHDPEVAYRQGSYQAWCDTGSIANEALIAITELIAKRGKA